MNSIHINMMAVLIAVVANFILGWLWYGPLFGKIWGKEMGMDPNQRPPASAMMRGMIIMIIGNFLMAYVFAHNIAAWGFVPDMSDISKGQNIAMSGIFTWMGFYLPSDLGGIAWERRSWKFFFINTIYHLLALVMVAAILYCMPYKG